METLYSHSKPYKSVHSSLILYSIASIHRDTVFSKISGNIYLKKTQVLHSLQTCGTPGVPVGYFGQFPKKGQKNENRNRIEFLSGLKSAGGKSFEQVIGF